MVRYYKVMDSNSVTMFYCTEGPSNEKVLDGFIGELRSKNSIYLQRDRACRAYWDSKDDFLGAESILENAIEITKDDYEAALGVIEAMIDCDVSLIDIMCDVGVCKKTSDVKTEPVYIDDV